MATLDENTIWYIYKLYNTNHVLPYLKKSAEYHRNRRYFTQNVLCEMLKFSTGEYIAKLINKFMLENPKNDNVRNFSEEYWDYYYYILLDKHLQKKIDLFLIFNFTDAKQLVNMP
tara:strand:- start:7519 stop:7863 length:345 start_codon:yes stop_codon:yes gene_type:complete